MSTIRANYILDAAGGNTATINGAIPAPATSPTLTTPIISGNLGAGGANYGTSGQVLTSGGSGSSPSWTSSQSIGISQTWQTVTRSASTSYQNTTGRPLEVAIDASSATARPVEVSVDNATWLSIGGIGTTRMGNQFIVPNNWYYRINGSVTLNAWTELR